MTYGCQKPSSWHTTVRPWSPSYFTSSPQAITRVDQPVSEQCCGKQFKMASDQLVTFPRWRTSCTAATSVLSFAISWSGPAPRTSALSSTLFVLAVFGPIFYYSLFLVSTVRVGCACAAFRILPPVLFDRKPLSTGNCVFKVHFKIYFYTLEFREFN